MGVYAPLADACDADEGRMPSEAVDDRTSHGSSDKNRNRYPSYVGPSQRIRKPAESAPPATSGRFFEVGPSGVRCSGVSPLERLLRQSIHPAVSSCVACWHCGVFLVNVLGDVFSNVDRGSPEKPCVLALVSPDLKSYNTSHQLQCLMSILCLA